MTPEALTQHLTSLHNPQTSEPAARALKHLAAQSPHLLKPHTASLLKAALTTQDLRTRWNLIAILGKLPLTRTQKAAATDWLFERLADDSPFTRIHALQALYDLTPEDPRLPAITRRFAETGTAAMRARARKLMRN